MKFTPFLTLSTLISYFNNSSVFLTIDRPNPNMPFNPFLYGVKILSIIDLSMLGPSLKRVIF